MSSSVRPELLTCVGSSASLQTRPSPLIYRGLTVQTNRATSGITYSTDSSRIIHQEFGQTVAVKKLTKIEKSAIKLSQWIN